jgi:hypothetical protein
MRARTSVLGHKGLSPRLKGGDSMKQQRNWSNVLLWAIYLSLLAVLLPHTAWAFARFEPPGNGSFGIAWGAITAWAAAFAFEAAIAALTHCGASSD